MWSPSNRAVVLIVVLVSLSAIGMSFAADASPADNRTSDFTTQAASFSVSNLQAPTEAEVDERIQIEATVTNTGNTSGSQSIQYRIGGNKIDSKKVELDAGASKRIKFSVDVPAFPVGNYTQGVFIGKTNQGQTSWLRITGTPSFEVSNLQTPAKAAAGDEIRVSATIRNSGTAHGETRIEYRFDDERLARKTVRLDPREQTTVTFNVQMPTQRLGTYRHGIFIGTTNRGQTSSIEIQKAAPRFDISGLDAPAQTRIGDEATIRARVTNTGTRAGSTTVEYRVGGRTLAEDSVSLLPDESKTVTLRTRYPGFIAGIYTQGVFRIGSNQGPTSTLSLTGEANFEIANLQAPARITTGDQIQVQATVINTGTAEGATGVQYRVADQRRASKQISLKPGERTTVGFDVQIRNNPSTYTHGVYVGDTQRGQTASLVVEGREPKFSVSNLRGPARAIIGDDITVEATVTNVGTGSGATDLQLRLDANRLATKRVNLRPGQQEVVAFTVEVSDIAAGTHRYGVFIGDSDQGQTSSIRLVSGQPRYNVADLSGPAEVTPGDRITVEATILNTGTGEGSTTIEYRFAGETLASQSINLAPGAETSVSFPTTVPDLDAGTYRHGVFIRDSDRGQTSSIVVAAPVQTEAPGLVGFGMLVGVVALLLVTFTLIHRQRDR